MPTPFMYGPLVLRFLDFIQIGWVSQSKYVYIKDRLSFSGILISFINSWLHSESAFLEIKRTFDELHITQRGGSIPLTD